MPCGSVRRRDLRGTGAREVWDEERRDAKSKRGTKGVQNARQVETRGVRSAESAECKDRGDGVHSVRDEGEEEWGRRIMRKGEG